MYLNSLEFLFHPQTGHKTIIFIFLDSFFLLTHINTITYTPWNHSLENINNKTLFWNGETNKKKNLSNEFIWRLRILCVVSQHNKNIDRAQHSFPFVPTNNSDGDDGVLFACIWHCLELLPSIQWTRWNSHVQLKKTKQTKNMDYYVGCFFSFEN